MLQCVAITATADTVSCLCRGACTTSLDSLSRVLFVLHRLRAEPTKKGEHSCVPCDERIKKKRKTFRMRMHKILRYWEYPVGVWCNVCTRGCKTKPRNLLHVNNFGCDGRRPSAVNWNEIKRILFLFFDENCGTKSFLIDLSSATICASFETIEGRQQRPKAALDCNPKIEEWNELNTKSIETRVEPCSVPVGFEPDR